MITKKYTAFAALSLLLSVNATAKTTQTDALDGVNAELEQAQIKWQKQFNLPSLVIAVNVSGSTVFNKATGMADIESNRPATTDTPYSVGSIAKSMTSLAMARLMDQGKLDIHQSIGNYADYQKTWQPLTSYQLASHTAGIVHYNKARQQREFEQVRDHWRPAEAFDVFDHEAVKIYPQYGLSIQF